jgi:hypothetical protein
MPRPITTPACRCPFGFFSIAEVATDPTERDAVVADRVPTTGYGNFSSLVYDFTG